MSTRIFRATVSSLAAGVGICLILLVTVGCAFAEQATVPQPPAGNAAFAMEKGGPPSLTAQEKGDITVDQHLDRIEQSLKQTHKLVEMAEIRSLQNKVMSLELIRTIRWILGVLIFIALVFPLTIWFLSKKRILELSGLSDEVASTLVLVEDRQAKLAHLLKEVQGEMDYIQSVSAPDLKNLMEQAEKYLEQNRSDLERMGLKGKPSGTEPAKSTS